MSTRSLVRFGPPGSGSYNDGAALEGENSSKLFMSETISRDVSVANQEQGLLSSLNTKVSPSTLRLNSSHKPFQVEPQSQQQAPLASPMSLPRPLQGVPSGPEAALTGLASMGTGPAVTPHRPTPHIVAPGMLGAPSTLRASEADNSIPSGSASFVSTTARENISTAKSRAGPSLLSSSIASIGLPQSYEKNQPRGTYSTLKSSRGSKWRRKLQRSRNPVLGHKSRDSTAEHSFPSARDHVSNFARDGDDTGDRSVVNHQKLVEADSLAESLSTLAMQHLNLDATDQSKDISNFVSYLLDTIQMLEAKVNYKEADSESSITESDSNEETVPVVPAALCFQTIHRIYCTNPGHNHDKSHFEDEPVTRRTSASTFATRLEAGKKIEHLESYLSMHPEFCFIVIKEHMCVKRISQEVSYPRFNELEKPSPRFERLAILSPLLRKALDQIAQYSNGNGRNIFDEKIFIDAPYTFLFHHRERLVELADDDAYGPVLAPLLEFLNDNYKDEYEEAFRMFDQGVINARHLPKLFQPNQLVILKTSEEFSVYALDEAPVISKKHMSFRGWSYTYAGSDLQQKMWNTSVSSVGNDDVSITKLEVYPVKFGTKEDLEKLTRRGQAFWGMKGQHYACYTGWDHRHEHHYSSARFMVDLATHHLMHPLQESDIQGTQNRLSKKSPWPSKIKWEDKIAPETTLLLPSTVYGFNLQEKKWVDLDVDKFHPVTWNKDAFKRLVLEEKTKEMIYALVDIQTATQKMDDIITGKGNGLIVLLHGSPGTGKTLTAESVAEIAQKPLYRVTCGDIGTQAQDVEKYLATVLYLGKHWDCVLLLDEADVFLEERTFADLQRNSLVSVFLRTLEYYDGILILTSNRVGHFDEAFKSRIQVAIHYDNLSKRSRKAIWQNFLDMIEESTDEDANIAELEEHLDQLASEEMNGRQIRNALLTARQLAKHRKERLEWVHLDQVMKTSAAFNKYLKTVRGQSDDKIAREEGRR